MFDRSILTLSQFPTYGVSMKYVTPSAHETSFNCPHCSALAKQYWYTLYAEQNDKEKPLPRIVSEEGSKLYDLDYIEDPESKEKFSRYLDQMGTGVPFLERR